MLSIFNLYKIGVGLSRSRTNGPMLANYHFTRLIKSDMLQVVRIKVDLFGSLSLTRVGHHTDRATILGLLGNKPEASF
ncbi:serine dehydratase beta chain [Citrobacter sp.]|uniref:serine dehydratase beta chain n=1 Tax=Citrobacter sp. TaxID=1896336 RepID=UPI003FA5492E